LRLKIVTKVNGKDVLWVADCKELVGVME